MEAGPHALRRWWPFFALALPLLGAAAFLALRPRPPAHIVLIVIDALRRDQVGCYGASFGTSSMDALCVEGLRFQNAVASFHQSSMSMAALFTGLTPSIESTDPASPLPWNSTTWCGLSRFAAAGDTTCVPAGVPTLAEKLRKAGYQTIGITSNPFVLRGGYERGFDRWIAVGGDRNWRSIAEGPYPPADSGRASGFALNGVLADWLARPPTGRFFLYVHFLDIEDALARKQTSAVGTALADMFVGALRLKLAAAHLLDDTVIVLTADYGHSFDEQHPMPELAGHHGNPSYEPVLEVPLIVWPDMPADTERLMRSEDVFRLIARIAGVPEGPPSELGDDELFLTERLFRTYRRGRWKSIWPRAGGEPTLFDLEADPFEEQDVAAEHQDVVAAHRQRVAELSRRLAAPPTAARELTLDERGRMRAIGYLD
jgi:arylsulfatase A-like enzyme